MALNIFMFAKLSDFFGNKAVNNGKETEVQRSQERFWKQRIDEQFCQVCAFSSSPFLRSILVKERRTNVEKRQKILYNFVLKINATRKVSWTFLPTLRGSFFTQFSPVHPFENDLYEETIKSFSSKKCNFGPKVMPLQ